jgi:radical SAM-linked protein
MSDDLAVAPTQPQPPAVQRWRLVVARDAEAASRTQRELATDWEAAVFDAGLPLAWSEGATPRPRMAFGAPLPVGMVARAELIDVVLSERWPAWQARHAIESRTPAGWQLVDLYDVWLGGPALPGMVAAADYRIELADAPHPALVTRACADLVAAERISRERRKGERLVAYDLRPLLLDVHLAEAGPPLIIEARTRFHPELGTGRPEEVIAALAETVGQPLAAASMIRTRLLLADDLERGPVD